MAHMPLSEEQLKKELIGLFAHIQLIRKELAALGQPGSDPDHFSTMADLLDAIVEQTEEASDTIMNSMEDIQALADELRPQLADNPDAAAKLDAIADRTNAVFEACSFQDLTGQRINKVLTTMKFIEERINGMIKVWGKDELTKAVKQMAEPQKGPQDMRDDGLLHGPQRKGIAVTQDQVDKLFNQDDIDKLFD